MRNSFATCLFLLSLNEPLGSEDWWWLLLSLVLAAREEAEGDMEVEVAVTGGGATLWPGSLGEGS